MLTLGFGVFCIVGRMWTAKCSGFGCICLSLSKGHGLLTRTQWVQAVYASPTIYRIIDGLDNWGRFRQELCTISYTHLVQHHNWHRPCLRRVRAPHIFNLLTAKTMSMMWSLFIHNIARFWMSGCELVNHSDDQCTSFWKGKSRYPYRNSMIVSYYAM